MTHTSVGAGGEEGDKELHLRFLQSPLRIVEATQPGVMGGLVLGQNRSGVWRFSVQLQGVRVQTLGRRSFPHSSISSDKPPSPASRRLHSPLVLGQGMGFSSCSLLSRQRLGLLVLVDCSQYLTSLAAFDCSRSI
jgi:hypothetical protein